MTRKKHSTELVVANQTTALALNTGPTFKDFSKFVRLADAIVERRKELERACTAMRIGSREAPKSKAELRLDSDEEEMIAEAKSFWETFDGEHLYDDDGVLLVEEIMLRIASTVGAVKVTGSTPEAFNERLVDHVSDISCLTWSALESACRELETKFKFLSISEAVEVVKKHVDLWGERERAINYLKRQSENAIAIFEECELQKTLQKAEHEVWRARNFLDQVVHRTELAEKRIKSLESEINDRQMNIDDLKMNIEADKVVSANAKSELDAATSKKYQIMMQIDEAKNGSK
jgi:hypothetical protein